MIVFRIKGFENYIPAKVIEIELDGHSGFAVKGNDIICSAVSVLIQTLEYMISRELELRQDVKRKESLYKLTVYNDDERSRDLSLLIKNCMSGLDLIQRNYPDHLKIIHIGEN